MVDKESVIQLPVGLYHAAPSVAYDADFNARWAAWVARGRVRDQQARRRFVVWAGVLAMGVAFLYAYLR